VQRTVRGRHQGSYPSKDKALPETVLQGSKLFAAKQIIVSPLRTIPRGEAMPEIELLEIESSAEKYV
jgi:hypothetical protein